MKALMTSWSSIQVTTGLSPDQLTLINHVTLGHVLPLFGFVYKMGSSDWVAVQMQRGEGERSILESGQERIHGNSGICEDLEEMY